MHLHIILIYFEKHMTGFNVALEQWFLTFYPPLFLK